MKDQILQTAQKDWVSFAELARIDGFTGAPDANGCTNWMQWPGYENLIIWPDVSREGLDAINELIAEKQIFLATGTKLSYFIDGCTLDMPLARSIREYKKPHWAPTFVRPYSKMSEAVRDGYRDNK
jgi:hypothetical protein